MNVITDWKNLRRLYDEINCRCKLNIFQGARVKKFVSNVCCQFLRNYGKQKKCQRTLDTNGDTNDFKRVLVFFKYPSV